MSAQRERWCKGIAVLLAAGALLAACDRVGDPLVGHQESPPMVVDPRVPCTPAPSCTEEPAGPNAVTPHALRPFDLVACQVKRQSCWLDGYDDDAGVIVRPTEGCVSRFEIGEFEPNALALLACDELSITNDGGAAELRLEGVDWSLVNVTIATTSPLRVELDAASLQDVYIRLEGPIELRVADSVLFEEVSIASPRDGMQQRIELHRVSGVALAVQHPGATFEGALSVTRSEFEHSQFVARKLALESVRLAGSYIESDDLTANDVEFGSSRLVVGSGTVSASLLEGAEVERCGALTLLAVEARHTAFAPCTSGPMRVYGGEVIGGQVDGAIQGDETRWEGVLIGAHAPSDLEIWEGSFSSVSFCGQSRTARFGAGSNVRCSRCDGIWTEPGAACSIPGTPSVFSNYCDALQEPPACSEPLPLRERPTIDD